MGRPSMMLLSSASEQNVFFTYVCLVGNIKPTDHPTTSGADHSQLPYNIMDNEGEEIDLEDDDMTMSVEKSQALHEIKLNENQDTDKMKNFENYFNTDESITKQLLQQSESDGVSESNEHDPKILELTRMNWLSESHDGSPDASTTSLSPTESTTSCECDDEPDSTDRYLSTILRLDREHNLFGLSNITIVGSKLSSKKIKKDDKAVFHQTAIIQVCYPGCCRHRSKTQLPASLRCNRCGTCCRPTSCSTCVAPSCTSFCRSSCPPVKSCCPPVKSTCPPSQPCGLPSIIWTANTCPTDCGYGLEIRVNKKPKKEPIYPEKEARSPCILHKPLMARSCHHVPRCVPPASCCDPCPMPCYWPGRVTAPCCEPDRCFHNPPCRTPRVPHETCVKVECPLFGGWTGECNKKDGKDAKCDNIGCLGNESRNFLPDFISGKDKKKSKKVTCECHLPKCEGCFVQRPKGTVKKTVAVTTDWPTPTPNVCKNWKIKKS